MAQTEWGWGGICQCSHWGSKVECKCLSLSNPTHFIFVTEKSVQGPQHFFQLSGCHLSEKSAIESPPPVLLYVVRLELFETCKVEACKEHTWTWRRTHYMLPYREPFSQSPDFFLTLLRPVASPSVDEQRLFKETMLYHSGVSWLRC